MPSFYKQKIAAETAAIGEGGPLFRVLYPALCSQRDFTYDGAQKKCAQKKCAQKETTDDFIDEARYSKTAPFIIQKYRDRAAFIITEECFERCQYCFRGAKLCKDKQQKISVQKKTEVLLDFLRDKPEIKEIIITGGDPLILNDDELEFALARLKNAAPFDLRLRIHTRAIIYNPSRFTPALIKIIKKINDIKIVLHIVHPYEICEDVKKIIYDLNKNDIALFAQYPLLRGINDNYLVQKELLMTLTELRVRPLSIFIVEPNKGSHPFRINFNRIEKIINELNWNTPSWINSVRLVLDTKIGKVRREDIICRKDGFITFEREGKRITYEDFPAALDIPGDIKKLLWRTA